MVINCCSISSSSTITSVVVSISSMEEVELPLNITAAGFAVLITTLQATLVDLVQVIVEVDVHRFIVVCLSGGRDMVGSVSAGNVGNANGGRTVVVTVTVCLVGKPNENII